jgi:putative hemolysin
MGRGIGPCGTKNGDGTSKIIAGTASQEEDMTGDVPILRLVLLVIALLLSAFFSSSETAFMSLQRVRLRHMERIGVRGVRRVRRLVDQADRTLVTILIGNNLVNTASAALATVIVADLLGAEAAVVVATIGVTILLLLIGEITPKTVAVRHSERVAVLYALPLEILARILSPLTSLLARFGAAVASLAGGAPASSGLSPEEIRTVVMMGEEAGVLHREETEILHNVLRLENMVVRELMVPRIDVVGVRASQTVEEVARMMAEQGYTRVPVLEPDLDHIVGIVHAKDALAGIMGGAGDTPIRDLMRAVIFIPGTKTVSSLLREMRAQQTQMAVVLDEYGGTAGIVTLEDLLEEVVGEITSEYGTERRLVHQMSEREILVDAGISVNDLNESFGIDLSSEDVDTLGGFVLQHLGRIPDAGERFEFDGLDFTIRTMDGRRIGLVRIVKQPSVGQSS